MTTAHDQLILVNESDETIGSLPRVDGHQGLGVLHRAFSVFLINSRGEVLLQRRSAAKTLWPRYWSNSCCSHPRPGERPAHAVARRMREELGVEAEPSFLYKFLYAAEYEDVGSEREVCWVWTARFDGDITANEAEVAETCWLSPSAIDDALANRGGQFTPWMHLEWTEIRNRFPSALQGGARGKRG